MKKVKSRNDITDDITTAAAHVGDTDSASVPEEENYGFVQLSLLGNIDIKEYKGKTNKD